MKLLIAGLGYTGAALAKLARDSGHEVWGVRRGNAFPDGIHRVQLDLSQADSLSALPDDVDAIAYLVGADSHSEAAYESAYILGLTRLIAHYRDRAAQPPKSPRLLFSSSTAVFGEPEQPDAVVDEETTPNPESFSGRVLLRAEALVAQYGGVVLRLGGIYGPNRASVIERVTRGELTALNAGRRFTNRIHRDDAARASLHLLMHPKPAALYVGVDEEPATFDEVVRWLESALKARGVQLGDNSENSANPRGTAPTAGSSSGAATTRRVSSKRCSSARLRASGYDFLYPSFRDGYASLLGPGDAAELSG